MNTNRRIRRALERDKKKLRKKLKRAVQVNDDGKPVMSASNIHYDYSGRVGGISYGGIGAIHVMVKDLGLIDAINENLHLLKIYKPYTEADHVLNIAYNSLCGGVRLEDIELRRQDPNFLRALDAEALPDPTTSGDFTRRFHNEDDIVALMEAINETRKKVWSLQPPCFLDQAIIDIDGTYAPTLGECKAGIGLNYKKMWCYHPLVITLANTKELLYLINREGQRPSHDDCEEWINKAVAHVLPFAKSVCLRGDTDFAITKSFDCWDSAGYKFVFGIDAMPTLKTIADGIAEDQWQLLEREPKYTVKTDPREKRENVKEQIIKEKGFETIRLKSEQVSEFSYQPGSCKKAYRVVVVRKNLSVEAGENVLFDDIRYFFYITNRTDLSAREIVLFANKRCDQENIIEQLKNGVNAIRVPVYDLKSNWAYMVMASLAWNLKSWFGLLMPCRSYGLRVVHMEYRRFFHEFISIPAIIIRTGRKIVYRIISWSKCLTVFLSTFERLKKLRHQLA